MTALEAMLARTVARQKAIDPKTVALSVLLVLPFVLGWVAKKTAMGVWFVVSFLWSAAAAGWKTATPESERDEA